MRVKYKNSVKDPGIQGVLIMNGDRFMFAPDDPTSVKLNVGVESLKQHLVNKKAALLNLTLDPAIIQGGGCIIFEFENFSDRNVCRDFVSKVLTKKLCGEDHKAVCAERLNAAEIELRMKLLQENSELQKLHKQFAITGVLSESEFWATRK
ncbi:hypothetical protein IFM89_030565 [Coptis chinensis]|uniref:BSD domain-containing protein n=1 Tax=Coptis chinensis TaxID=261450 RepID=A0A835LRY9_9MAGN|nr:hypothetical protein IFM89_030565 [Coptis chinensis]